MDIASLSDFQKWGLAHATRLANEEIISYNNTVPDEQKKELYTVQTYLLKQVQNMCNSYWESCQKWGLENQVIPKLTSLSLEEQVALRQQYNIPNVIPDEYLVQLGN